MDPSLVDPSLELPVEDRLVQEAGQLEAAEQNENDEEGQEEEEAKPKRAPRKRKRRALDSHFAGMTEDEIAAFKASVLGEPEPRNTPVPGNDEGTTASSPAPEEDPAEAIPHNRLAPDVIQARRRVLRTDWRMAAFSQFSIAFPHLCLRDFDINKLEQDLEGSYPGSYVGEVISRLMYTLTKDSRLAGDETKEKPWLVRLRREFVRRDPAHNKLGDGPLSIEEYWEDDDVPRSSAMAPRGSENASADVKPPMPSSTMGTAQTATAQGTSTAAGAQIMTGAIINGEGKDAKPTGMSIEERPLLPTEWTESYGWEDLTISEQIYALWSITEWHLQNADKFRNYATKYRVTEEEHITWRIEPIGRDSEHSVYWLFDDNRLWIERETPLKRELRIVYEEAQAKVAEKRRLREKRIRRQQKQRMHALHERRRQRTLAKKAAEERLDREIEEIDARQKAEGGSNGRGKRKRAGSEDEDAEVANVRTSSRVGHARLAERMASRPPRRKSMRGAGSSSDLKAGSGMMQVDGEEDWQQIPAEWLKSEDQEKDEDPDFGDAGNGQAADDEGDESESDLSNLDEEEEALKADMAIRSSQRRSPRKVVGFDGENEERADLSDLSDLSDGGDMSADEEPAVGSSLSNEIFPESAYNLGPSFDDEDTGMPDGFVRFEAICTNLEEWTALDDRFGDTEDPKELTLLAFIKEKILPGVQADYEAREKERQRQEVARKAAERKQRLATKAAQAAALEAASAPSASTSKNQNGHATRTRSSRNAKKELTEEEKRQKALSERVNYNEKALFAGSGGQTRDGSESLDAKAIEVDRRALRARQREEEKRAREEAELMQELQEAEGEEQEEAKEEPQEDVVMQDVPVQLAPSGSLERQIEAAAAQMLRESSKQESAPPVQEEVLPVEESIPVYDAAHPLEMVEDNDYRLDCSVCRRRGMNLDANQRLVQCDHCDRWEHVTCHRKAAEKAGLPKPDFDNDPFVCEDCQEIDQSVIVPVAAKRARSDKQMEGARKGAEKRRAKFEANRLKNGKAPKAEASSPAPGLNQLPASTSPPISATKTSPKPRAAPKAKAAKSSTPQGSGGRKRGRKSAGTESEEPASAGKSSTPGLADQSVAYGHSNGTMPAGPSFQLNGAVQDSYYPSNISQTGSDIPIDPNLASRPATPMSRQSTETGVPSSMVPLPSFLGGPSSSSSIYQPYASGQFPSTASIADMAIPGLQQNSMQPIPAESAQSSADAALSAYIAQIEQNQYSNPEIDPLLMGASGSGQT